MPSGNRARVTGYGVRDTEKTAVNYVGQHQGVALLEAEAVVCILQVRYSCPVKY